VNLSWAEGLSELELMQPEARSTEIRSKTFFFKGEFNLFSIDKCFEKGFRTKNLESFSLGYGGGLREAQRVRRG
jgi:hypothetical protein